MTEFGDFNLISEERMLYLASEMVQAMDPARRASLVPGLNVRRVGDGWVELYGLNAAGNEVSLGAFDPRILISTGPMDVGSN
jgi:hypothetical protein